MALTRKFLKALGIEDEKIDQIIEAHTETTDALMAKVKEAEDKVKDYDEVAKERNALKKSQTDDEGYKERYEKEHADFEEYKKSVAEKETQAAREKAARAYFASKNIKESALDIVMRGSKAEVAALALDADGKIKDTKALDDLIGGTYSMLITTKEAKGVDTSRPPANSGASTFSSMTLADKMKYANEHPSDSDVVNWLKK